MASSRRITTCNHDERESPLQQESPIKRRTIPPVDRMLDPQHGGHPSGALPLGEAPQTQRLPSQACIQGNMKFTNCGQVNIASNVSQSVGRQNTDGGPLLAAGDLVFENCDVVNILAPQDPMPSIPRRQSPSHRTMRRPVQSTREHQRQRPQRPEGMQSQVRSQDRPPGPPTSQLTQLNALPQALGQSYLPTGIPMQTQSYHPPPQFHMHDQYLPQAYHAGPSQAHIHVQEQPQPWPQTHYVGPTQTQVQRFDDPPHQAQQMNPRAYPNPLRIGLNDRVS